MKLVEIRLTNENEHPDYQNRTVLLKPDDLSPYAAYLTLKGLFGEPNRHSIDNKSQWSYELKVPNAILDVYDWKIESWSVGVYADSGDELEAKKIGQEFVELLQKQAQKYNSQIKSAAINTENFILQNPFALYYQSASNLMEHLKKINSNSLKSDIISNIMSKDICRAAFFLFMASFEGLLNLIYELYLKPELRDERIYDRLSREQIDIKLKLAPLYCSCFKDELIDGESEEFKNFHSIINLRNDFIHANLTKAMKTPVIFEDGCMFILSVSMRDKLGLPKNISELRIQDLLIVEQSIDNMINILIKAMKPRYKKEFKSVMEINFIHIEKEDGELIVIGGEE
ncbi:hypothetical protein H6G97_21830 [Nostoc flagelliforme FACHB-838]|uniref:Apea-like HEPN domain-containing protein n=1 Tax=Nostoc flagelliforme FACHB-838 TaxID=2692904 RepID=A0ABR8DUZ5_9NOSO|nr:hypothetical protein [Nostoc flagelliforme]MBD2532080.1 hypothetical protein [Nostoc flagelliforme FACHB-838]